MAWYNQLYQEDIFDFGKNKNFIYEGKQLMQQLMHSIASFKPNPTSIFLDRTRYGLFRLFERLNARVEMKNI